MGDSLGNDGHPQPYFNFVELVKLRIWPESEVTDTSVPHSLLAVSPLSNQLFVGVSNEVAIINLADLHKLDELIAVKSTMIDTFPKKRLELPSHYRATHIVISHDELTLLVVVQTKDLVPIAMFFDCRGFSHQAGSWLPFQEMILGQAGCSVVDCVFNPTIPGLVAVCMSDGNLHLLQMMGAKVTLSRAPSFIGAEAITWSGNGNHLYVFANMKLMRYKWVQREFVEDKSITINPMGMVEPIARGLQWISKTKVLVTFRDHCSFYDTSLCHLIVSHSWTNATEQPSVTSYRNLGITSPYVLDELCRTFLIQRGMLLVAPANATEWAVLQQSENGSWSQWRLPEPSKAKLPSGGSFGTAFLPGSQFIPPGPTVFSLSSTGLLSSYIIRHTLPETSHESPQVSPLRSSPSHPATHLRLAALEANFSKLEPLKDHVSKLQTKVNGLVRDMAKLKGNLEKGNISTQIAPLTTPETVSNSTGSRDASNETGPPSIQQPGASSSTDNEIQDSPSAATDGVSPSPETSATGSHHQQAKRSLSTSNATVGLADSRDASHGVETSGPSIQPDQSTLDSVAEKPCKKARSNDGANQNSVSADPTPLSHPVKMAPPPPQFTAKLN